MALTGAIGEPDLDYVEFFSGAGTLSAAMRGSGLRVEMYDKKTDPVEQQMNTPEGLCDPAI